MSKAERCPPRWSTWSLSVDETVCNPASQQPDANGASFGGRMRGRGQMAGRGGRGHMLDSGALDVIEKMGHMLARNRATREAREGAKGDADALDESAGLPFCLR